MKNFININKNTYDRLALEYEKRLINKSDYEEKVESLCSPILRHVNDDSKHISVLEVGPGAGEVLNYFENSGCKTFAVELSHEMARIAKKKSPNSIIVLGNILDINFMEEQFTIIYAGALIHLFPIVYARELLSKLYEWLKIDGVLFINTTINEVPEEGFFIKNDYGKQFKRFRKRWTENELKSELIKVNFKIEERLFTDEKDRQKKWVAFICKK